MNMKKKAVAWILSILLVCSLAGCTLLPTGSSFSGNSTEITMGGPVKYYFRELDETEKQAYNAILMVIDKFPERVEVPMDLTKEQLLDVHKALLYDNPAFFFLSNKSTLRQNKNKAFYYPQYVMGVEDYNAMLKKCDIVADKIIEEAKSSDSTFEQERIVHDSIIAQCAYSDDSQDLYKSTIYGALCGGTSACEGYAKTAKYIFDKLGIECFVMTGNSTPPGAVTQSHMWNVIKIDGEYYHLDLTWDDPVLENGGSVIRYDYFNVNDERISKTHTNYSCRFACTATEANYFIHEEKILHDFMRADREAAAKNAAQVLDRGSGGFTLRFSNEAAYLKAQKMLFDEEGIYDFLTKVRENTQVSFATDRVSYVCSDETYSIDIMTEPA